MAIEEEAVNAALALLVMPDELLQRMQFADVKKHNQKFKHKKVKSRVVELLNPAFDEQTQRIFRDIGIAPEAGETNYAGPDFPNTASFLAALPKLDQLNGVKDLVIGQKFSPIGEEPKEDKSPDKFDIYIGSLKRFDTVHLLFCPSENPIENPRVKFRVAQEAVNKLNTNTDLSEKGIEWTMPPLDAAIRLPAIKQVRPLIRSDYIMSSALPDPDGICYTSIVVHAAERGGTFLHMEKTDAICIPVKKVQPQILGL